MRTSRLARQTAKVAELYSPSRRRSTRSNAAAWPKKEVLESVRVAEEDQEDDKDGLDDESELSSAGSEVSFDIEDQFASPATSRKRKRHAESPWDTAATSTSRTSLKTRISPRKKGVKVEEHNAQKVKKAKRQPAKEVVNDNGEVEIHPPAHWEEVYRLTQEMRKETLAPVDTMGCDNIAEDHRSPKDQRFQTLFSLMLSSQTKDTTNAAVMRTLQKTLKPSFNLASIRALPPDELNELIFPVGFHNNKTRYIKATAEILHEKFDDDIPPSVEGLMSLPGVGPKMAYLCMSSAWGKDEGIGVDVHVHRITNLWAWHKTKTPEETRLVLQAWLPREKWHEINHLLVGFGQTICAPVGRKCGDCKLADRGLCPSAIVDKKKTVKGILKKKSMNGIGDDNTSGDSGGTETLLVKDEEVLADGQKVEAQGLVVTKAEDGEQKIKEELEQTEFVEAA